MKSLSLVALLILSAALSPAAKADALFTVNTFAQAQKDLRDSTNGAYVSAGIGNGSAEEGGEMEWRSLEVRFGQVIGSGTFAADGQTRIDFVHYNEGHPDNNHRDGFAVQLVFRKEVSDRVKAEIAAGPYFSMNTTTIDGKEMDDKEFGILTTAALLYYLNSKGLHVRAAYNHAIMPDGKNSDAFEIGFGQDFDGRFAEISQSHGDKPNWVSASASWAKTNHGGTESAYGGDVEFGTTIDSNLAASVAVIHEGDDGTRVDRDGVAAQLWFVQPLTDKWTASAGVGPYVANNHRGDKGTGVNALISVRAERTVGSPSKGYKIFVDFNRVVSRDQNDRDIIRVGVKKQFR